MSTEAILLGPVSFASPTQALGGPKAKGIFALLARSAGSVVSDNELIDGIWESDPPAAVNATLQAYVSRLRRMCVDRGHDIQRVGSGYCLDMPRANVDAHHLADVVAAAERNTSPQSRATELTSIAALLGGEPLGGCPATTMIDAARQQLEATQLTAVQLFASTALLVELELPPGVMRVADRNPAAEAAQAALCKVLWHRGRTAEARQRLRWVIDHCHSVLGCNPSATITRLDRQLSAGGPVSVATSAAGTAPVDPVASVTKTTSAAGLVGRADEQRALRNAVSGGDASVVIITGEGGIGKTTLARATLPRALWADPAGVGSTPWPWVWDLIGAAPPQITDDATLYEVLDISTRAIVAQLHSDSRPRTLIVDDLHNRSTVARLQFAALARAMAGTKLNLVGISRDHPSELQALAAPNEPTLTTITVNSLSDEDAHLLVQQQLQPNHPQVQQLVQDAGGVPLLISQAITRVTSGANSDSSNNNDRAETSVAHRRLIRLVALAGRVDLADLIDVLGSGASDAVSELAAAGQLVVEASTVSFAHERLAELALDRPSEELEVADVQTLAKLLLDRWDGDPQAAVSLSVLLDGTTLSAPAVHLAAGAQHQLARDWQAAAMAYGRAASATEGSQTIAERAAECWIRAGDIWTARELLGLRVDRELEAIAEQERAAPEGAIDLGPFVEYISFGTTGFRMDERVRSILRHRPTNSVNDPHSVMLDAVELTESRRGTVRGLAASSSADALLERARATGDRRAVTWALGPRLVEALNTDDHLELRDLADELETNAAGPEQAEIPVVANWYRFEAALRRGDGRDADAQLDAIRHRAQTTMEVPSRWYHNILRAGRLLNDGRFDEAEQCLQHALELGSRSIGSEAHASYGAGLLMIRWFQDRTTELLAAAPPPTADDAPVGAPTLGIVFGALIRCLVPGSADPHELARAAARASNSLEHALVAEAALAIQDQSVAYGVLADFRPRAPMVVMPAGLYVSAAESVRGRLLALTGDHKSALAALRRGAEVEVGAGAMLASKRTGLAYASALIASGDRSGGHRRAVEVEHWARSRGVPALERQALELRAKSSLP